VSCYVLTRTGLYSNVKIWKTWKERKQFSLPQFTLSSNNFQLKKKTIFLLFLSFLLGNILCHENDPDSDSDSSWNRNSLFGNCSKQSMKLYLVHCTFIHFIIIIHSNCPINRQYWILFFAKLFSVIERKREKKTHTNIITSEKLIIFFFFLIIL